ncbi:Peptidase family M1 [Algoriphagus locisalis]|uniref:Peptidase family M1 n=1 Tax=Algoriphagus locisalis TaxID=305507 RepID=A0A1I6XCU4_9BACT|nr:M1 family aminopeptidase [Algoriphagus locisalis]SFT36078.1 Peptidase family M1 [Algoriphagus locisalis]
MRQFFQLIRFELIIQSKTLTVPFFALAYFGFAFLMGKQGAVASDLIYNSEFQLFFKMGLLSLGAVFSIMFFVVKATQRDRQSQMEALIFVTPISKKQFFITRFLGAWLLSLLVMLPAILGFHLGISFSDLDPIRIADFRLWTSFSVIVKLLIPTWTTCTALLFTVGLLSKNPLATYAMAVGIYAVYFICSIFLNSPLIANSAPISAENLTWAALADPFGLSAFFHQTNLWTSYEKNQLGISFSGLFAWNRLIWLTFSTFLLAATYRIFSFRMANESQKSKEKQDAENSVDFTFKRISPKTGNYRAVFGSQLRISLQFILKSIPFWAILGAWAIIAISEIYSHLFSGGSYEESYLPASQILLDRVQQPLFLFGILLQIFLSSSLMWREKDNRMQDLVHATPSPKGLVFLANLTALVLVSIIMLSLTVLICLGFQLADTPWNQHTWVIFSLYLSPGWNLLFFSVLFLLIQHLCQRKYLGMGLSALAIGVFAGPLGSTIGLTYPLFRLGNTPFLIYSELAGFELQWKSFLNLGLLWGILGLAIVLWLYTSWEKPIYLRRRKLPNTPSFRLALFFFVLFLGLWVGFDWKIRQEGSFISPSEKLDRKERYEKAFKHFEDSPVLAYAELKIDLDMQPSKGNYTATVEGKLFNPFQDPISEVLIQENEKLIDFRLEKVTDYGYIEELGLFRIQFSEAIQPGDTLQFSFGLAPENNLLGQKKSIVKNGSYLNLRDFVPFFGYAEYQEISDYAERKKRNLPPKPSRQELGEHRSMIEQNLFKVNFEAIIRTESPQVALTSGDLLRVAQEGNQSIFHYRSPRPILPGVAFFSGNYHQDSVESGAVHLEVYSSEAHSQSNAKTLQTMKETLDYLAINFGKYPFDKLKLVEIPGFWGFGGYAHPTVISMVEDKYYLVRDGGTQFDLQTKRAVHEVAHQWFGHLLAPRNVPGAGLFVEGLAKYAEVLLLEKLLGKSTTWYLCDQANRTYFAGRANDSQPENSLSKQERQSYLAYGKSLAALLAARDLLGEKVLNGIIRELLEIAQSNTIPTVDAQLFLDKMMEKTSPEGQELLADWFQKIITYDIRILNTQIEKAENGLTQVTIDYEAAKNERQADGSEQAIPMAEDLELTAFAVHPKNLKSEQEILFSQPVRIHSGKGQLKIKLHQVPAWIALDPWGTRSDQNREDNFQEIMN